MPNRKGKITNEDLIVSGIDIRAYKEHPRIVELRTVAVFGILVDQYGMNEATNYYRALCSMMKVDWARMSAILNSYFTIRRLEGLDKTRYRQEVLVMGMLWGETRWYSAKYYLGLSHTTVYSKKNNLVPANFMTRQWLDELANNVAICGQEAYKLEALRFLEKFDHYLELVGNVSISS